MGRQYAHILRPWFTCGVIVAPLLAASISYILVKEMANAAAWLYGVRLAFDPYMLLHDWGFSAPLMCNWLCRAAL